MPSRSKRNPQRISVWSHRKFGQLDARLAEGREEKRIIEELSRHVGAPSFPQQVMIRRAARLLIMLQLLEQRIIEEQGFSDIAGRQICALHNALRLSLQAIGLTRPEVQVAAPLEYLAAKRKSAA